MIYVRHVRIDKESRLVSLLVDQNKVSIGSGHLWVNPFKACQRIEAVQSTNNLFNNLIFLLINLSLPNQTHIISRSILT